MTQYSHHNIKEQKELNDIFLSETAYKTGVHIDIVREAALAYIRDSDVHNTPDYIQYVDKATMTAHERKARNIPEVTTQ